ncbi:MAG: hypothetical protein KKF65_00080 [Nanoarchaeota archaeon]|nr:hypothetical protein [Nanoarchaeota archaeon]
MKTIYSILPQYLESLVWYSCVFSYSFCIPSLLGRDAFHKIKILLNRSRMDGYLITDFVVSTVRGLQMQFPMIRSARYKDKTFFYLQGREEETIEAFFREKPDRIISYSAIEELSYLLGVKISNKDQHRLLDRFKKKHDDYWRSRRLIQRSIDDWIDEPQSSEISFRLMSKRKY